MGKYMERYVDVIRIEKDGKNLNIYCRDTAIGFNTTEDFQIAVRGCPFRCNVEGIIRPIGVNYFTVDIYFNNKHKVYRLEILP